MQISPSIHHRPSASSGSSSARKRIGGQDLRSNWRPPVRQVSMEKAQARSKSSSALGVSIGFLLALWALPAWPPTVAGQSSSNERQPASAREALELTRVWAARFGHDVHYGSREATCMRSIRDQFDPAKSEPSKRGNYKASVESIDWTRMHSKIVDTVSSAMGWHRSAVEMIARESEYLAGNHTFVKDLKVPFVDVHNLQDLDETAGPAGGLVEQPAGEQANTTGTEATSSSTSAATKSNSNGLEVAQLDANGQLVSQTDANLDGLPVEPLPSPSKLLALVEGDQPAGPSDELQNPTRELRLSKHPNFGEIEINAEESAVHVPVHIYPGESRVMNGIAWSEELTKVFRANFVRNPRLTNQYFASQYGFMRLFPAQKWQIGRMDPDLYDARMRPWYSAGASSPKDVVILVDASGSMTGSRRDIARGVVFEILDTLTDNDHFLILKFSDKILQVGVPSCPQMRSGLLAGPGGVRGGGTGAGGSIPPKNTLYPPGAFRGAEGAAGDNDTDTDIESFYMLPASGRNIRHVKTNFTIATSGIANFSHALITAFEVLQRYQGSQTFASQCNQAIMLVTDGSPSDFSDIFNRYNYPNAPVRVFTYLIGREAGDVSHTKWMACQNRGYYTHVINLAEVRETVQQYIPVMARPMVLNGTHPVTWTPAYGELTYQVLTDWIWESKRREKARAILTAANAQGVGLAPGTLAAAQQAPPSSVPDIQVTNDDNLGYSPDDGDSYESALDEELDAIDLFGYNANPACFWQTHRNDLLTTVVQPVYDRNNQSLVVEKYLVKNVWRVNETMMRTAQLLGIAAADMQINDIVALAPSHKLGANGYAIMLTNNGYVMHHPDLRSILEPFSADPSERNMKIMKPFSSSLDFTQVEHIVHSSADSDFVNLRQEAVLGLTGWRELLTKRTIDCHRRVQTRRQKFYYKAIQRTPFSFMVAIPQPYGSHRLEAQMELKSLALPERLTTFFTTSDFDLWTIHPDYQYCDGPSNNSLTTLLDLFQRIEQANLDDIQWRPEESTKPPVPLPGKIVCSKDLVQSLVYDAVATYGFAEACGLPSPGAESSFLGMFGVRFSFVATRSGLTRVRHYDKDDLMVKKEALAFARKHARAIDETYYSRTVDFNMLVNESATLVQVPFNAHEKIADRLARYEANVNGLAEESPLYGQSTRDPLEAASAPGVDGPPPNRVSVRDLSFLEKLEILANSSLHVIATESIIVNEGAQRAVAGVSGVFYDYATFVLRFLNATNDRYREGKTVTKSAACFADSSTDESCDESKRLRCGYSNDTIDCLLVDNNGYIIVSEDLAQIGRHLNAYEPMIMRKLIEAKVFQEVNITDYQAICIRQEEKQPSSGALSSLWHSDKLGRVARAALANALASGAHLWTLLASLASIQGARGWATEKEKIQPLLALMPNKTYLRPCQKTISLYELRPGAASGSDSVQTFRTRCGCDSWLVFERVPLTNMILITLEASASCLGSCQGDLGEAPESLDLGQDDDENLVCNNIEREAQLYRKKLDYCFSHHPDEEHIKICGSADKSAPINRLALLVLLFVSIRILFDAELAARRSVA